LGISFTILKIIAQALPHFNFPFIFAIINPIVFESRKIVGVVGMAGSGKTEVARAFEQSGFTRVRFGDITDEEVAKRGLVLNEDNERRVRELLRKEHGMVAYAKLNLPKIDTALENSNVVVDGLYSWEEYTFLKDRYGEDFSVVAVWASPEMRYARLSSRAQRPLTNAEAAGRDRNEIENTNKGGPIAMADYTIINESSMSDLEEQVSKVLAILK
jgi:dephospho-CoA kinase